jgi:hypothetical protein
LIKAWSDAARVTNSAHRSANGTLRVRSWDSNSPGISKMFFKASVLSADEKGIPIELSVK